MNYPPVPVIATLSVPLAASTTTLGAPFQLTSPYDTAVVFATLTGMSAGTLNVYIQESWDGGTTWSDVASFAQLAIGAAASTTRFSLSNSETALTVGTAGTPALAAGKFADGPWAPILRIVSVTGVNANAAPVVQTIKLIPWRNPA